MEDREPYITGGKMRDKFLTEAMGECWHEPMIYYYNGSGGGSFEQTQVYGVVRQKMLCIKCESIMLDNPDFSTWEGFGKLWEWAIEQDWWQSFLNIHDVSPDYRFRGFDVGLIKPEVFADTIYKYLKNRG